MNTKTLVVISFCLVFLLLFIIKDFVERFFFIALLVAIGYIYYGSYQKSAKQNSNVETFIDQVEKELSTDFEMPQNKIFYVHKTPRSIKYIKKMADVKKLLFELKFVQIYDRALYNKIVSYTEYFFKLHYNILLGKYEFQLYYPVLLDIRAEILNAMKGIYFNTPSVSTILDIKNVDEYIENRVRLMQSITYKYIKLLCNKHKLPYKPPFGFDKMKDNHYALF